MFRNEITAGTTLIREAIQSQGYQTGVQGWSINADGSAEFNDITIRAGTVVSGTALYYSPSPGAGKLILAIAAAAGTDEYGNSYPQGLTVFGTDGTIQALGNTLTVTGDNGSVVELFTGATGGQASVDLTPRNLAGAVWTPASIYTALGASNRPGIGIASPYEDNNPVASSVEFYGGGPTTSDNYILASADRINLNAAVEFEEQITRYNGNAFNTYTPVVGNGGSVTWTALTGWYVKIGKMVYVSVRGVVNANGSGTGNITITMPSVVDGTSTDQILTARFTENRTGYAIKFQGSSSATLDRVRTQDQTGTNQVVNIQGADLQSGRVLNIEGWYREA